MKNRIMKQKKSVELPLWLFILFGICMVILSFNLSGKNIIPEKLAYISYLSVMPDAAVQKAVDLKNDIYAFFFSPSSVDKNNFFIQKFGDSKNEDSDNEDSEDLGNTTDLTVTPEDILMNEAEIQKKFDDGTYKEDGVVSERTFYDDQATDSYKNIHVRNVTDGADVDIETVLNAALDMGIDDCSQPTVLIYHTHSTETYIMTDNGKFSTDYSSRNEDKSLNMIRIGDEITRILKARGIGVIHDRNIYDWTYTGAYSKSREGILKTLDEYPTIKITLDIHRDAVYYDDYTRMKPVAEIDGEKAAQMMIITGAEGGNVDSFPSWETNLNFALKLQKTVNDKYENMMKPIYFCNRRYNMDVTPYSLLIEVGTDVNTLKEAAYSGRLLGDALAELIIKQGSEAEK